MKNKVFINKELELGRQMAKQNCTCSLPTPPAALPARGQEQTPPTRTLGFNSKLPKTSLTWVFWRPIIKDEWKVSVRAGAE